MRRTTSNVEAVAATQQRIAEQLRAIGAEAIARELTPFVTEARAARLQEVFAARLDAVTVVMDAPHDPHNGAAVIRSCDAFGVHRLHVVERLETFLSANSVSRGSERWVDVKTHKSAADAIDALRASGHAMIATHPDGELLPQDLASIPRVALVLGNEKDGIHAELVKGCERSVRIPMRGFAESLNVSVTGAILLEHATAGRPGDLDRATRTELYARALLLTVPHAGEILAARRIC